MKSSSKNSYYNTMHEVRHQRRADTLWFVTLGPSCCSFTCHSHHYHRFSVWPQPKYGISKRERLEQSIHLKIANILDLFCSLQIQTSAPNKNRCLNFPSKSFDLSLAYFITAYFVVPSILIKVEQQIDGRAINTRNFLGRKRSIWKWLEDRNLQITRLKT